MRGTMLEDYDEKVKDAKKRKVKKMKDSKIDRKRKSHKEDK